LKWAAALQAAAAFKLSAAAYVRRDRLMRGTRTAGTLCKTAHRFRLNGELQIAELELGGFQTLNVRVFG
jgi:hypothetical protein